MFLLGLKNTMLLFLMSARRWCGCFPLPVALLLNRLQAQLGAFFRNSILHAISDALLGDAADLAGDSSILAAWSTGWWWRWAFERVNWLEGACAARAGGFDVRVEEPGLCRDHLPGRRCRPFPQPLYEYARLEGASFLAARPLASRCR